MKITCDMALDLIALYFDGAASSDSCNAVREHLDECPTCQATYAAYKRTRNHSREFAIPSVTSEKYAELAEAIRRKHQRKVAAVTTLVAVSMLIGASCAMQLYDYKNGRKSDR